MSVDFNQLANDSVEPDGRARNAVKHGMAARQVVVVGEDVTGFEALRAELLRHWRPLNVTAYMLVDHLARCQWRLMRAGESEIRMMEVAQSYRLMWDGDVTHGDPLPVSNAVANDVGSQNSRLARMQVFQGRLERSVQRTINLLIMIRKSRGKLGNSSRNKAT